jgi:hypothetical protein
MRLGPGPMQMGRRLSSSRLLDGLQTGAQCAGDSGPESSTEVSPQTAK